MRSTGLSDSTLLRGFTFQIGHLWPGHKLLFLLCFPLNECLFCDRFFYLFVFLKPQKSRLSRDCWYILFILFLSICRLNWQKRKSTSCASLHGIFSFNSRCWWSWNHRWTSWVTSTVNTKTYFVILTNAVIHRMPTICFWVITSTGKIFEVWLLLVVSLASLPSRVYLRFLLLLPPTPYHQHHHHHRLSCHSWQWHSRLTFRLRQNQERADGRPRKSKNGVCCWKKKNLSRLSLCLHLHCRLHWRQFY